jgi:hypothetical protein
MNTDARAFDAASLFETATIVLLMTNFSTVEAHPFEARLWQ